jgi:putative ABC transport system permease protein
VNWWQRLLKRNRLERELDAELRYHFDRQVADYVRSGMPAEEGRRRARAQFGGLDQIKEGCRDARGTRWVEDTAQDLRFAVRLLAKDRAFTLVAVITLALGIGANTAMFSVIESVLLAPLPYRDPERVVWISENNVTGSTNLAMVFAADVEEWRSRATSFDALSVLLTGDATMGGDEPVQVRVACLSESLTRLFGMAPAIGRDFLPADFERAPQAPGLRPSPENRSDTGIAVLSDRLFRRLGGDLATLGESVTVNNVQYTVVGVLPPSFRLPVAPSLQLGVGPQTDVDVILNTTLGRTFRGPGAVLARLKPGTQIASAFAELEGIRKAANQTRPKNDASSDLNLQITPLHDHVVGGTRRVLLVLWASVGFVLLVACVNIVSLLLARGVAREPETAIRIALGAGRWRLVRQMLAENMVLVFLGGAAGILLGYVVTRTLAHTNAIEVPRLQDATLNGSVLLFSAAVCVISGILLSVIPALRSGVNLGGHLKASTGATASSGVRRWHSALVVCELALAMIPLTGAGLMLRSLWQVQSEGAVLTPQQVLMARIQGGSLQGPTTPPDRLRQSDQLVEEIESLPGVRAAALWNVTFGYPARISGLPQRENDAVAMWFNVSPHFREASGLRLLAGRWFTDEDRTVTPPVVIVSERFARTFSADVRDLQSVVGRTTFGPFSPLGSVDRDAPMTIIGVVSDFRSGRLGILRPDDAKALPQVFFPDVLRPIVGGELLVRTASSPLGLVDSVRKIVHSRPRSRLMAVRTLDDQLSMAVAPRSFNTLLTVAFAGIALLLTIVGVSGVLRYSVAQRTHEIGLRLALGAREADILRMILSYAVGLVVAGVAIGVSGSAALSTLIAGVLYGVTPTDPVAYVAVTLLLVTVAVIAAYLPARRAMRLDPMMALRHE